MVLEAMIHSFSRVASAAMSFLLFALVGRYCRPEEAKAVYFFSFSLGFLIVSLRTFSNLSARLKGTSSRSTKLRAALVVTGQLFFLQIVVVAVAIVVFGTQPLSATLVGAACLTVAVGSFDSDLLRAALNKRSSFSLTFACGGGLAVAYFYLAPAKTVTSGGFALLLQWLPVSIVNLYFYGRLFWRRSKVRRLLGSVHFPHLAGGLLVAVFDGAVLNAPFLIGSRLGAQAGLDLSVATRIFVSSLPLYPLVMHWSNTRTLARMAEWARTTEPRLYSGIVALSGGVGGVVLSLVYSRVSGKRVSLEQYLFSVLLLTAFSFYAARLRYALRDHSWRRRLFQLSGLLGLFYLLFVVGTRIADVGAFPIVALQASTLLLSGLIITRPTVAPASCTSLVSESLS
jgi:hypothetical protein